MPSYGGNLSETKDENWTTNVTFATNWKNRANHTPFGCKKINIDTMLIQGVIKKTIDAVGSEELILTIPEGYRPKQNQYFNVPAVNGQGTDQAPVRLILESDGELRIKSYTWPMIGTPNLVFDNVIDLQ